MVKRVLMHVGLGRTGTLAIQRTLAANRPALTRRGALYPGDGEAHHDLLALVHPKGPRHSWYTRQRISPVAAKCLAERQMSSIRAAAATGAPVILLSSQHFQSMGSAQFSRLDDQIAALGYQLETLCYIQHPLTHTASRIEQGVKQDTARIAQMMDRPYPPLAREHCDAALRALGANRVHLRRTKDAVRGGLTEDLLRIAGLNFIPGTILDYPGEPRLCHDAIYLLDAINAADTGFGPERPTYWEHQAELFAMKGHRFMLPPTIARRVQAQARIEQDWLFRHFGTCYPAQDIRDVPTHWQEIEWARDTLADVTEAAVAHVNLSPTGLAAQGWPQQPQAMSA